MSIKKYKFALKMMAIPTSLIASTDASTLSAAGGLSVQATRKTLNASMGSPDGLYISASPVRFFRVLMGDTALGIGGSNASVLPDKEMVIGLLNPITNATPTLRAFDVSDVICGEGGASTTDAAAILTMRNTANAKLNAATAAAAASFATPALPTSSVTVAVSTIPTPAAIVAEVPLVLPTFALDNTILNAVMKGLAREAQAAWKDARGTITAPTTNAAVISNNSHYSIVSTVKASGLYVIEKTVEITLYVDTLTGAISVIPLGQDALTAAKLAYEQALMLELQTAYKENRDAVLPTSLPAITTDEADVAWKQGMDDLVASFNAKRVAIANTAYEAAVAAGETATKDVWLANQTFAAPTAKTGAEENSPWWKTALGTISSGASAIWDTVTDWGPTGLATGYGIVTATNEAKKNNWLVPAAIGLGLVFLVRK